MLSKYPNTNITNNRHQELRVSEADHTRHADTDQLRSKQKMELESHFSQIQTIQTPQQWQITTAESKKYSQNI